MFLIEILPSLTRRRCLLHSGSIFRMGALDDKFHGRLGRLVISKDSEGLV